MTDAQVPRVLVVLLNYRTAHLTLKAADAALADIPAGAELVIVDNASGDGSDSVLTQAIAENGWSDQGRVRLILSPVNGGFGAGNNIGMHAGMSDGSRPDYYYILNSDAFPDHGCLPALIAHMQATPQAGFVGSHVRGEDDVPHTTAFRFPSVSGEFEGAARFGPITRMLNSSVVAPDLPTRTTQVDWVAGASVLMRASMIDSIGGFDESFFLYFEETDLCKRAANAGWQCWYLPEAKVVHIGSVSTGMKDWQRMPTYWFASRRHYFVKNHGLVYAATATLAQLAGGAIHLLRCAVTRRTPHDPAHFYRDLMRFSLGLAPRADTRSTNRALPETRT